MEGKVLLEKNLFRIILEHALTDGTLSDNYKFIYLCTMVCKKWRLVIFKILISHFKLYNYTGDQFDFDNTISCSRIIERGYFESDSSPYKNPNIKVITKYRITNPKHYVVLIENSDELKKKHERVNARFRKIPDNKICKICSIICQARTICGKKLKKIDNKIDNK